jgi:hypothetical protein
MAISPLSAWSHLRPNTGIIRSERFSHTIACRLRALGILAPASHPRRAAPVPLTKIPRIGYLAIAAGPDDTST